MRTKPILLVVVWLVAAVARPASADLAQEIAKRWESLSKTAGQFDQAIARDRGEEPYLPRYREQMLRDAYWIKDRLDGKDPQRALAIEHIEEFQRLKDPLAEFLAFKRLQKQFLASHATWIKTTSEQEVRLIGELARIVSALQQDYKSLSTSQEAAGKHHEQVRRFQGEVKRYLFENKELRQLRLHRERVQRFQGRKLALFKGLGKRLKWATDTPAAQMERLLSESARRFADLLRGLDHPKLRLLYRQHQEMSLLLRKNLAEIHKRAGQLREARKRFAATLNERLVGLVQRRQLEEAMKLALALYKELGELYREMSRSQVAAALDLGWCRRHAGRLKALHSSLAALARARQHLDRLAVDLSAMAARAPGRLKATREAGLAKGAPSEARTLFGKLREEFLRLDQANRKEVARAREELGRAVSFRERKAFEKVSAQIAASQTGWIREGAALWKSAHAQDAVQQCLDGPESATCKAVLRELMARGKLAGELAQRKRQLEEKKKAIQAGLARLDGMLRRAALGRAPSGRDPDEDARVIEVTLKWRAGALHEAMRYDVALHDELLALDRELRKTPVAEALDLAWLASYRARLRSLHAQMKRMESALARLGSYWRAMNRLQQDSARALAEFARSTRARLRALEQDVRKEHAALKTGDPKTRQSGLKALEARTRQKFEALKTELKAREQQIESSTKARIGKLNGLAADVATRIRSLGTYQDHRAFERFAATFQRASSRWQGRASTYWRQGTSSPQVLGCLGGDGPGGNANDTDSIRASYEPEKQRLVLMCGDSDGGTLGDARLLKRIEKLDTGPEWIDVVAHGSPNKLTVTDQGGKEISADWNMVFELLKKHLPSDLIQNWKARHAELGIQGICLIACQAGAPPWGSTTGMAQQLANLTGMPVKAALHNVYPTQVNGRIVLLSHQSCNTCANRPPHEMSWKPPSCLGSLAENADGHFAGEWKTFQPNDAALKAASLAYEKKKAWSVVILDPITLPDGRENEDESEAQITALLKANNRHLTRSNLEDIRRFAREDWTVTSHMTFKEAKDVAYTLGLLINCKVVYAGTK